jgi:hypothetical protein
VKIAAQSFQSLALDEFLELLRNRLQTDFDARLAVSGWSRGARWTLTKKS